jgi:hypothetical protein
MSGSKNEAKDYVERNHGAGNNDMISFLRNRGRNQSIPSAAPALEVRGGRPLFSSTADHQQVSSSSTRVQPPALLTDLRLRQHLLDASRTPAGVLPNNIGTTRRTPADSLLLRQVLLNSAGHGVLPASTASCLSSRRLEFASRARMAYHNHELPSSSTTTMNQPPMNLLLRERNNMMAAPRGPAYGLNQEVFGRGGLVPMNNWAGSSSSDRVGGLEGLVLQEQQRLDYRVGTTLTAATSTTQLQEHSEYATNESAAQSEPFPTKLHRLLREAEAEGNDDIISFFLPDGRTFKIHKPNEFFKKIVPRYFKHSQLNSFKRQLNLYGFELIIRGLMKGAYYHTDFQKHRPELCKLLRRRDVMFSTRPSGFYGMVSKGSSPETTEDTQRRASPDLNLSSTIEKPDESE